MIETWGFSEDIKGINLMMMMTMRRMTMRWGTTMRTTTSTRTTTIIRVSQLWDMIDTWGFCKDIKGITFLVVVLHLVVIVIIIMRLMPLMSLMSSRNPQVYIMFQS